MKDIDKRRIEAIAVMLDALKTYNNILETEARIDGIFCKRGMDEKWWAIVNPARRALHKVKDLLGLQ